MQPKDFQAIRSKLSDLRVAISGYEKRKKALKEEPRPSQGMREDLELWRKRVNDKLGPFKKFVHELADHD